jgi:hypothetical protein
MAIKNKKSGPHVLHRLTDVQLRKIKTPGAYADGGGLYLQVAKTGAKSWLFRYARKGMGQAGPDGKARGREMGLGALHTITMPEARDEALRCRKLLLQGIDPLEHRRLALGKANIEINNAKTFDACAVEYIAGKKVEWTNAKHVEQWTNTLKRYISPAFGALPVQLVDVDLVYRALHWSS